MIIASYTVALLMMTGQIDAIGTSSGQTVSGPLPPMLMGLGLGTLWYTWRRHRRIRRERNVRSDP